MIAAMALAAGAASADVTSEKKASKQSGPSNRDIFLDTGDSSSSSNDASASAGGGSANSGTKPTVKFWVERASGNSGSRDIVLDGEENYTSGDKVWFKFASNVDGYVYLINKGSSGTSMLLFPGIGGMNNHVKQHQDIAIPSNQQPFMFDEKPGVEALCLVVSPQPIPEFDEIAKKVNASRGFKLDGEQNRVWTTKLEALERAGKSRDLILQSEDDGNYATDHSANGFEEPIYIFQELRHLAR
jgi:hypothetical protein